MNKQKKGKCPVELPEVVLLRSGKHGGKITHMYVSLLLLYFSFGFGFGFFFFWVVYIPLLELDFDVSSVLIGFRGETGDGSRWVCEFDGLALHHTRQTWGKFIF